MKKSVLTAVFATIALAASTGAVAMTPKNVHYTCQGDKELVVNYSFNRQDLPTKAIARINGARRVMPIDLARSDAVGTRFSSKGYVIDTDYMDASNYNQLTLGTVTANNKIVFKGCQPD